MANIGELEDELALIHKWLSAYGGNEPHWGMLDKDDEGNYRACAGMPEIGKFGTNVQGLGNTVGQAIRNFYSELEKVSK